MRPAFAPAESLSHTDSPPRGIRFIELSSARLQLLLPLNLMDAADFLNRMDSLLQMFEVGDFDRQVNQSAMIFKSLRFDVLDIGLGIRDG